MVVPLLVLFCPRPVCDRFLVIGAVSTSAMVWPDLLLRTANAGVSSWAVRPAASAVGW
jgi:hypothetical protein